MLLISEDKLQKILQKYQGRELTHFSEYTRSSLEFFGNRTRVSDPRVEFTSQLDITEVYSNYLVNFKSTPDATFTAFVKWHFLKEMQGMPFCWRCINGNWYEFSNLPLEVTARVGHNDQVSCMINDATHLNWS